MSENVEQYNDTQHQQQGIQQQQYMQQHQDMQHHQLIEKLPNPDPAKLNQARSGWLYNHSQIK